MFYFLYKGITVKKGKAHDDYHDEDVCQPTLSSTLTPPEREKQSSLTCCVGLLWFFPHLLPGFVIIMRYFQDDDCIYNVPLSLFIGGKNRRGTCDEYSTYLDSHLGTGAQVVLIMLLLMLCCPFFVKNISVSVFYNILLLLSVLHFFRHARFFYLIPKKSFSIGIILIIITHEKKEALSFALAVATLIKN